MNAELPVAVHPVLALIDEEVASLRDEDTWLDEEGYDEECIDACFKLLDVQLATLRPVVHRLPVDMNIMIDFVDPGLLEVSGNHGDRAFIMQIGSDHVQGSYIDESNDVHPFKRTGDVHLGREILAWVQDAKTRNNE